MMEIELDNKFGQDGASAEQGSPIFEVSQAFQGLSDGPVQEIYRSGQVPTSLFHYTSSVGLMGIISNKSVWFSNSTFLNDGSETTWGVLQAAEAIENFFSDKPQSHQEVGERLREEVGKAMQAVQPVVFCMSARPNLLNQWRDYGKDIVPYCIEFDVAGLEQLEKQTFRMLLTKLVYAVSEQQSLLNNLLGLIYRRALEEKGSRDQFEYEEGQRLLRGAAIEIVKLIARFKNPAFEAEQEYRAISFGEPNGGVRKYRPSSLGVVPYYEWSCTGENDLLPIKSVMVGPSPYAQVSDLALKNFLADHGYNVETRYSTIPIRRG